MPAGDPILPADSRALRYGDGFFETLLIRNGKIQLADWHLSRLTHSLQVLQFDLPKLLNPTRWFQQAEDLAVRNGHAAFGRIRLTVFRGAGGLFDPENLQPHYLIETWNLPDHFSDWNENGLVLGIANRLAKSVDSLANLKHNNYLLYAMAALQAKAQHWNDALVLNTQGNLADSTIANVFLVEGDRFVTPQLEDGPVAGVRRRDLIQFIRQIGGSVEESTISPERLLQADEVFLTNAIRPIRWVQRIEDQFFANEKTYALYLRYRATIS